jgi:hypothetical protein
MAGFLACVEDAQRLRLPSAPLSPPGAYRFAPDPISEKEKIPLGIKFPLHLSLDCLDVRGQAQRALAGKCYPKTTGKRVTKRHAEKLLIYAAFER